MMSPMSASRALLYDKYARLARELNIKAD